MTSVYLSNPLDMSRESGRNKCLSSVHIATLVRETVRFTMTDMILEAQATTSEVERVTTLMVACQQNLEHDVKEILGSKRVSK